MSDELWDDDDDGDDIEVFDPTVQPIKKEVKASEAGYKLPEEAESGSLSKTVNKGLRDRESIQETQEEDKWARFKM